MIRVASKIAASIAFLLFTAAPASAQDFPNRLVRIVVPYPAGGGVDAMARALGDNLSQICAHPISRQLVNNPPGLNAVQTRVLQAACDEAIRLGTHRMTLDQVAARLWSFMPDPVQAVEQARVIARFPGRRSLPRTRCISSRRPLPPPLVRLLDRRAIMWP